MKFSESSGAARLRSLIPHRDAELFAPLRADEDLVMSKLVSLFARSPQFQITAVGNGQPAAVQAMLSISLPNAEKINVELVVHETGPQLLKATAYLGYRTSIGSCVFNHAMALQERLALNFGMEGESSRLMAQGILQLPVEGSAVSVEQLLAAFGRELGIAKVVLATSAAVDAALPEGACRAIETWAESALKAILHDPVPTPVGF